MIGSGLGGLAGRDRAVVGDGAGRVRKGGSRLSVTEVWRSGGVPGVQGPGASAAGGRQLRGR